MDHLRTKGQTALEYLLIVVVAIIVVVAVMVYMGAQTSVSVTKASWDSNVLTCTGIPCANQAACGAAGTVGTPSAPTTGSCFLSIRSTPLAAGQYAQSPYTLVDCTGINTIGTTVVPGKCTLS